MEDDKVDRTVTSGLPNGRSKPTRKDPQGLRTIHNRRLEIAIGREVRALRRQRGLTFTDLSAACGLSIGMLSKIENGRISPSLSTLQSLGAALSVPLTTFFRTFDDGGGIAPAAEGERQDEGPGPSRGSTPDGPA